MLQAQPADYQSIMTMFSLPDQIVSLEFSKDSEGVLTYNLHLKSTKKIEELADLFKNKGLAIVSVKYSLNDSSWKLLLKKLNDYSLVDLKAFNTLLNQPWKTVPGGLSVLVSSSEKKVFCEYSEVNQLGENVKVAQDLGMKIADSIPHKNTSIAIFAKDKTVVDSLPNFPVPDNPVPDNPTAAFLSEFGKLRSNDLLFPSSEYDIEIQFNKIPGLIDAIYNKHLKMTLFRLNSTEEVPVLSLKLTKGLNNKTKIEKLKKLLKPDTLPWASQLEYLKKGTYVCSIVTNLNHKLYLNGLSSQSSEIFTVIFPKIKSVGLDPFFTGGTYSDYPCGRMIHYGITCRWKTPSNK